MKTPFIPTAMRCNQEQFEAIKDKLIARGCDIKFLDSFGVFEYLANNFGEIENNISNVDIRSSVANNRTAYQEWNEEIFLSNLGGEDVEEVDKSPTSDYENLVSKLEGVNQKLREENDALKLLLKQYL